MNDTQDALPGIDVTYPSPVPAIEYATLRHKRAKPKSPSQRGRPKRQFGPAINSHTNDAAPVSDDSEIQAVQEELLRSDPLGSRFAYAIRQAFDQAYDGQRTGRWDYSQLMKTEKTHIGTLVEIWLQREFGFHDGNELDFEIAGCDVDAKWTRNLYEWEIPLEMYSRGDKIALLIWANEDTKRMAVGLLRISDEVLRPRGQQRDGKRRLNERGVSQILWTHNCELAFPNVLLGLDAALVERIAGARYGTRAVELLFREAQGHLIDRTAVVTAAQQVDAMRRARGARARLADEGIVIFGHYRPHPELATDLGLPKPALGRFVSAKLNPWSDGDPEPYATIGGKRWRLARCDEPLVIAPNLPEQGKEPG